METLCHRVPGVVVEQLETMERSRYRLVLRGAVGQRGSRAGAPGGVYLSMYDHWSGHTSGEWEMRP